MDGEQTLLNISRIPISSWNYKGHDKKKFRHYGPMAQDFHAAFGYDGVGAIGDPTSINTGDAIGVLMAAVKALETRTKTQADRIEALQGANAELRARLETIELRMHTAAMSSAFPPQVGLEAVAQRVGRAGEERN